MTHRQQDWQQLAPDMIRIPRKLALKMCGISTRQAPRLLGPCEHLGTAPVPTRDGTYRVSVVWDARGYTVLGDPAAIDRLTRFWQLCDQMDEDI